MADLFDIVVARKLSGGGGGGAEPLMITITDNGSYYIMNKTYAEIKTAFLAGRPIIVPFETEGGPNVLYCQVDALSENSTDNIYNVRITDLAAHGWQNYSTDSINNNPSYYYAD